MIILTEEMIEQRLRQAVSLQRVVTRTPRRLAAAGPLEHEHSFRDIAEALAWLDWLDDEDAALVQARLEGARWKMICWRFGISRPTAYRRWRKLSDSSFGIRTGTPCRRDVRGAASCRLPPPACETC